MKFLLDEPLAREVLARLSPHLSADPHAEPSLRDRYRITTLYCDTPQLHVYGRVGRYRRFKLRLRQYGTDERIHLERKTRQGDKVRKRRSTIHVAQLERFAAAMPGEHWDAAWYHRQLLRNFLAPVCLIEYERAAYYGSCSEGPLRLTFDREIRGGLTSGWSFDQPILRRPLLADRVVCEFKFRDAMPSLFKSVVQELHLTPAGVSKYRQCMAAAGAEPTALSGSFADSLLSAPASDSERSVKHA
jgi:hypothetical protein